MCVRSGRFVDDEPLALPPGAPPTLGLLGDLPKLVAEMNVKQVIVAYTNIADDELLGIIRSLDGRARVQVVPRLYELVQARGFELGRISVLDAGGLSRGACERGLKRAFDIIVASLTRRRSAASRSHSNRDQARYARSRPRFASTASARTAMASGC